MGGWNVGESFFLPSKAGAFGQALIAFAAMIYLFSGLTYRDAGTRKRTNMVYEAYMHIHRTTPEDIWNRVKMARRANRTRSIAPHGKGRVAAKMRMRAKAYFSKMRGAAPEEHHIYPFEIAWSFVGSLIAIGFLSWCDSAIFHGSDNVLLMGTFGASAMLLFGAPETPFAQPRNVIGGHVVSAFVAICVLKLLNGMPHVTPALAVAGAIIAMHITGTPHPPGGGTALFMVTGSPAVEKFGFFAVAFPIASGTTVLVLVALVINNLARDRRYPITWW